MLSLADQVMPIGQAYTQLQVPAPGEAATSNTSSNSSNGNSSTGSSSQSTKANFETLQKAVSCYQYIIMTAVQFREDNRIAGLQGPLPADVEALQKQLLFGPVSHVAAVKLTAACRYLHAKHSRRLEKQQQERRQQQQQRGGCRRAPRGSSSSAGGQGSSSSTCRQGSNGASAAAAGVRLAEVTACAMLLPSDHELMAAVLGENAVATICRDIDARGPASSDLMTEILACMKLLEKKVGVSDGIPTAAAAAGARSQEQMVQSAARSGAGASSSGGSSSSRGSSSGGGCSSRNSGSGGSSSSRSSGRGGSSSKSSSGVISSTNSSSGSGCWNSAMLKSAPGMQLLLELLALLVAEAEGELQTVANCVMLLGKVLTGALEAERWVFLSARGGLLVRVFALVVQVIKETQQQQQQGLQQQGVKRARLEMVADTVVHCMLAAVAGASGGEDVVCEFGSLCRVYG